jgi:hypothetical protein
MTTFARILGADGSHRSRVHTLDGDRAGWRDLASLPGALAERVRRSPAPAAPWIAPGARQAIARALDAGALVLELGGGASTAWFAARAGAVVVIEPSAAWAAHIRSEAAGYGNVIVIEGPVRDHLAETVRRRPPALAVVDHTVRAGELSRPDAVDLLAAASVPTIVLDDSDRYLQAGATRPGYRRQDHTGFRSQPLRLTKTTLFLREDPTPGA